MDDVARQACIAQGVRQTEVGLAFWPRAGHGEPRREPAAEFGMRLLRRPKKKGGVTVFREVVQRAQHQPDADLVD